LALAGLEEELLELEESVQKIEKETSEMLTERQKRKQIDRAERNAQNALSDVIYLADAQNRDLKARLPATE
jgi:hypothetical protein